MENGEIGAPPMGQERRNKSGRRRNDRRASDKPTLTNEQSLGGVLIVGHALYRLILAPKQS